MTWVRDIGLFFLMIGFNEIKTILFDLDNTLINFEEEKFVLAYGKQIHTYFLEEMPDYNHFMKLFLSSTQAMLELEPKGVPNFEKFGLNFSKQIKLPKSEIIDRFLQFYDTDFDKIIPVISPHPIAKTLLKEVSNHFDVVLATNPLFPKVATLKRLNWGGIGPSEIPWLEITYADFYSTAKPHLAYYEEILNKIHRKPSECMMVGNDRINDMVAGKLGIKTFLVNNKEMYSQKIIRTDLDHLNPTFPVDGSGTIIDFYNEVTSFINEQKN